jgi:hypothetical protein
MEFGVYLDGGASPGFLSSVRNVFEPLIAGMAEAEAANLLIRFVQTALDYATDQEQFNVEKWMLPEETIHYPYSDCDDRSILYAWLVRELLDREVMGVQWPGHMAVAVVFESDPGGAGFSYEGKRWTICDPTYFGADIGMVPPIFDGEPFEPVRLKE